MPSKISQRFKLRRDFSTVERSFPIPDLIQIQKNSYRDFILDDVIEEDLANIESGIPGVFKSVFPIKDYNDTASLEFVSYKIGEPKYDELECQERGSTFAAPLKVTIQLVIWDVDEEGERQVRDIKEQEVYFGEVPLMTERGTFVINGTERVIVSQLHRSPGVFFSHDSGKTHATGKLLYSARVIPYRGSWLDLEFDPKDLLFVRIDRKRKQNASILLRALGLSAEDMLKEFYQVDVIERGKAGKLLKKFNPFTSNNQKVLKDIKSGSSTIVKAGQKLNKVSLRKLTDAGIKSFEIDPTELEPAFIASTITQATEDIIHPKTGDVLIKAGKIFKSESELFERLPKNLSSLERDVLEELFSKLQILVKAGQPIFPDVMTASGKLKAEGTLTKLNKFEIDEFELLYTKDSHIGDSLAKTLLSDGIEDDLSIVDNFLGVPQDNAAVEIYKRLRPGDPPRVETAKNNFNNLFFNEERYDLSAVGRLKIDFKLHRNKKVDAQNDSEHSSTLNPRDIIETVRYLLELRAGYSAPGITRVVDDIDHLGNRRVRSVGELVENQFRIGLLRMEKATRERMGAQDIEAAMPQDLINYKPVSAILKEFFGSSQLSQFMDQSNPLSEVTHKRRLSALGPGGLTRERAGFEVRDVHTTHYGRICPIETPEGPNIGLISSMAIYGAINKYGFVVTPYRKVTNNVVSKEVVYLTALEEEDEIISQSSVTIDKKGKITDEYVSARIRGEFTRVPSSDVTYIDVASDQLVSVATSLIPFLENDDANRALMGSNMQRQAVPLVRTSAPFVGTGMEKVVARDSGAAIVAKRAGVVESVDSKRIVVKAKKTKKDGKDTGVDFYPLKKYKRSNQNTCINQRPIVEIGDVVSQDDIIADGQSTDRGELALGQNILVAFMPWGGYNFEDSILVSERLVRDDTFTSIHIEEFECVSRDTRMGPEEITRDIPNVGEEDLANLDESGIIKIGAEVKSGCILVGKVTPKSENQLSPEEKLLRAIFGEKAGEVKDTSLRLPPSVEGTVVDCRVFSRQGSKKDERMLEIEQREIEALERNMRDEIRIVRESAIKEIIKLTKGVALTKNLQDEGRKVLVKKGTELTSELINDIPFEYLKDLNIGDDGVSDKLEEIVETTTGLINDKRSSISNKIKQMKKGDELPPGVVKMVKVFVAVKRRLSVGDKMAGRHGNKGVVSRILPAEDMPYLPDGSPVDMVLNPLGVPSRMNVGQVLETHLGWACTSYGRQVRNILEKYFDPNVSVTKAVSKLDSDKRQKLIDECKNHLSIGHPSDETKELVDSLSDKELMKLVQKEMEGLRVACPVFEAAKEEEIQSLLKKLNLEEYGQTDLFDGRTGEKFKEKVTVGIMYMLKLHHLVDEKIHARSIGPYSLVTQQPLGGKAQFGGQRLGEMEVWALEAYGAAHALQEFLTVKSDDVSGRTRMYESIVKGEHSFEPGLPESLKVMVKELKSLALDVNLVEPKQEVELDEVEALKAKLSKL